MEYTWSILEAYMKHTWSILDAWKWVSDIQTCGQSDMVTTCAALAAKKKDAYFRVWINLVVLLMSVDLNFKFHDGKLPFLNLTYEMWDKNNNNIAKLSPSEAGLHTSASSMSLNRDWYNYSQIIDTQFHALPKKT